MADSCLLSIVLPVYNVEKFVGVCLTSILNQDFPENEVEVICVNDGSKDGSVDIVKEYAEKYPCVKLISQQNKGVSTARNTGLCALTGEYVWFVDADDFIAEGSVKAILDTIKSDSPDGIVFDIIHVKEYENSMPVFPSSVTKTMLTDKKDIENWWAKDETGKGILASWLAVFKVSVLKENEIKYNTDFVLYEDAVFFNHFKIVAKKLVYLASPAYSYRLRSSSATHLDASINYQKKRVTYMLMLAKEYEKLYKQYNNDFIKDQAVCKKNEIYEILTTIPDREFVKKYFNEAIKVVPQNRYDKCGKNVSFKRRLADFVRRLMPVRLWFWFFYNLHRKRR